jgi:hypothetical protein
VLAEGAKPVEKPVENNQQRAQQAFLYGMLKINRRKSETASWIFRFSTLSTPPINTTITTNINLPFLFSLREESPTGAGCISSLPHSRTALFRSKTFSHYVKTEYCTLKAKENGKIYPEARQRTRDSLSRARVCHA